ncbi:MAG: chromosomal replication initiator protein DnaA [Clostridia bacterium]
MEDCKKFWDYVLADLARNVTTVSFDMWFSKLTPLTFNASSIVLVAPLKNFKAVLNKEYKDVMLQCIRMQGTFVDNFLIITTDEKDDFKDISSTTIVEDGIVAFNENYTFENFVVGDCNQIAYAAALAVAREPGKLHNPLFIYGGVGLGKTHIMHAIGNYIHTIQPYKRILYVNTEQFINDFVDSIGGNKDTELNQKFRRKYRDIDVLMLDDVQFIAGKRATQEALFHTFNELYQSNKQIVLSSDKHPKELSFLEERLQSRFQCGLTVDITAPGIETRIAILQKKALAKKTNVAPVVINFIAEKIDTNIRELEGALSKVLFYCSLVNKEPDNIDIVKDALKDYIEVTTHALSIDTIVDAACAYFNISKLEIVGKKKLKQIVLARQIAIYLINDLLGVPLATIGSYFGGRDHTTIIYARDKITEQEKTDNLLALQIKDIRAIINKK